VRSLAASVVPVAPEVQAPGPVWPLAVWPVVAPCASIVAAWLVGR
jgi:hypothetical protein